MYFVKISLFLLLLFSLWPPHWRWLWPEAVMCSVWPSISFIRISRETLEGKIVVFKFGTDVHFDSKLNGYL